MTTASAPREPLIVTEKLSKTFSNAGAQQHVLKNLDLEIEQGSFTVIMGPSGAGKSTLLYALSGMDRPTLGTVTFAGENISSYSEDRLARFRRRHCGFMFQQIHLLDSLSVMDNVMAVGLLTRDRRSVRARAEMLFDLVGLSRADTTKFPGMLSGGEAARVALVRGLIGEPEALFADEPTGQLNSEFSRVVLDLLTDVNAAGQTVVMVTHDVRSAAHGSRILYLRDGSIQGELELADPRDAAGSGIEGRQHSVAQFLAEMGW
ncbi:MAG: ABC transporter ATP-binding protein [Actinomycetia bacterium]|nr:ABC transporter ATP-binding protein [Actinomycetes bacterium]